MFIQNSTVKIQWVFWNELWSFAGSHEVPVQESYTCMQPRTGSKDIVPHSPIIIWFPKLSDDSFLPKLPHCHPYSTLAPRYYPNVALTKRANAVILCSVLRLYLPNLELRDNLHKKCLNNCGPALFSCATICIHVVIFLLNNVTFNPVGVTKQGNCHISD